jgi:DNA-binding transcriptional MocR family regulator
MSKPEYLKLADAIAAEIADGTFKPGDRLSPQRNFAYDRKIAVSTAGRVYAELLRRGLVVGEVGRGTFISGDARRGVAAPSEPRGIRIDLEFNYPMLPDQTALIAKSLNGLEKPAALDAALRQGTSVGTPAVRSVAAAYLSQGAWSPAPEQLVFTGNGRQSIAAALAAVVPTGGRCGVEALTYPFIKGIAARLGISLVPLAMDEGGVRPDSVQKAHREAHLSAIYIQPAIHNPLGMTMTPARRADLLRVVEKLNLPIIEDNVYGFLDDEPPLAALAPDSCIVVDSLSKKVAPGLTLGFIVPPQRLRESVMASVRSGGWTASGFAFAAAQRMMRRHRCRAYKTEATRCARASETGGRSPFRLRNPDQRKMLSSVVDVAGALALADFRHCRSEARHRLDTLDDLCRRARPCAERREAGAGGPDHGPTRYRPAHIGRDAERQGGGFRFDRMSEVSQCSFRIQGCWARPTEGPGF